MVGAGEKSSQAGKEVLNEVHSNWEIAQHILRIKLLSTVDLRIISDQNVN